MATRIAGSDTLTKEQERAKLIQELERRREETDRRSQELLKESQSVRKRLRKAAHG